MLEIVYLEPNKKILKEIIFTFGIGFEVIGVFLIAVVVGMKIDQVFHIFPTITIILLLMAFIYIIKRLIGVGKK